MGDPLRLQESTSQSCHVTFEEAHIIIFLDLLLDKVYLEERWLSG